MMNPKTTNPHRPTSSVAVPGGRLTVKVLKFLLKPLLKAQWQAGYEIGMKESKAAANAAASTAAEARFEAWKARQRAAGVEFVDDDTPQEHPPTLRRQPAFDTKPTFPQERP